MLSVLTLTVAALATWQVTEVWHHSSLFATWRGRAEAAGVEWATCPFCFAQRAAIAATLWLAVAALLPWPAVRTGMEFPVFALAAARAANVLNDVTHRWCRTPRANRLGPPAEDDDISGNVGDNGDADNDVKDATATDRGRDVPG